MNLGLPELIIILIIIMLLFGANRIPDIARSLGRSVSEFKKGAREGTEDDEKAKAAKDEKKPEEKKS